MVYLGYNKYLYTVSIVWMYPITLKIQTINKWLGNMYHALSITINYTMEICKWKSLTNGRRNGRQSSTLASHHQGGNTGLPQEMPSTVPAGQKRFSLQPSTVICFSYAKTGRKTRTPNSFTAVNEIKRTDRAIWAQMSLHRGGPEPCRCFLC